MRTYSDGKNSYSVDLMFLYIKNNKHPVELIPVDQLTKNIYWWDDITKTKITAKKAITNKKKYKEHYDRIMKANLSYSIMLIVDSKKYRIVDGNHRLALSRIKKKQTIKAYIFSKKLMSVFKIAGSGGYKTGADNMMKKLYKYEYGAKIKSMKKADRSLKKIE